MASNPPPFQVEDNTDEDFFDKLVNDDDDDMNFKGTTASLTLGGGQFFSDGNDSDEAKAFANLSINELDNNNNSDSKISFDDTGNSNPSGIDNSRAVEETNSMVFVKETAKPLVSSNSFEFDHPIHEQGNEDTIAEVLSDTTVVSKSSGDFSDTTVVSKSSGESEVPEVGAPGVKEKEWSAFHADPGENDSNGFGSYSDFFSEFGVENAGVASGNVADFSNNVPIVSVQSAQQESPLVANANDFGQYNERNNTVLAADQSNFGQYNEGNNAVLATDQSTEVQDLNSSQYWENMYPGWKYDPATGQWIQIEGYEAVQENADTNLSSAWGASENNAEVAYLQQTAQSVTGTLPQSGTTESVSNWNEVSQVAQVNSDTTGVPLDWNQASQENNGYPPHMVFDPQYPGWYYDTIAQEWRALDSYTAPTESTTQVQDQTNQEEFASTNALPLNNDQNAYNMHGQGNNYQGQGFVNQGQGFVNQGQGFVNQGQGFANQGQGFANQGQRFSNQGQKQNWGGSTGSQNHQQSSNMWQHERVTSVAATSQYSGNQQLNNHYGKQNFPQQNSVHHGISGSQYENVNQSQSEFSMPSPQGFAAGGNLNQFNNSRINRNDAQNVSNMYYSNQNSVNFSPQQIQSVQQSYNPASGRSSAGRPPHALVAFGFGGKLIVMKDNSSSENLNFGSQKPVKGSISVLNLAEVVNENVDASNNEISYFKALCHQSLPGPLTGGSVGIKELNKWIDERIANPESAGVDYRKVDGLRLLLSLLKLGCQYYGKLRSPYGTDAVSKESDGPESAVAKLFANAKRSGSQYGAVAQCLQQMPSEAQIRVTAAEVQSLLVSGRQREALQCAQEGQLWGPALVLAAQLGDQFYAETVKQMALHQLVAGSPLRTLCLLIAGQPADVFSADTTGAATMSQQQAQFGANGMLDDWEENLAVITANRTKDDELVLIHLGDCLWKDRSDIIAAQICYLVAEANFEPYSDSARMCLVGADHWKFPRTYASPEAIQRTEIYEYSKTLGNSQFVLLSFQPYKLLYAHMLAEVGRLSDALKYCQAVLKSVKTGRTPEVETLRHLVSSLEERIKAHQQGGFSTNLAPKKLVGKLLDLFDSTAHRVVGGLPPPVPTPGGGSLQGNVNHRVSASQSTMAMSSLVQSESMEPISEWGANNNNKMMSMHARSVSEPDFGRSPMQEQGHSSNESSSTGEQDKPSASSGTSRFSRFGFGSQLLQKTVGLVLKPRQGKQAKLGDSNKFYYDEKLKRWVEEGAAPPAEEAALPPPPTTSVFQNGTLDYNLKGALHHDTSNRSPEFMSPGSVDNNNNSNSGIPPLPPTSNQYSARGRMGVRSRYVDTFNQGGGGGGGYPSNIHSSPSIKPSNPSNPKFFVPAPISSNYENNPMQDNNTSSNYENNPSPSPSPSPLNGSFQSPIPPSSSTMQRFASMNNIGTNDNNYNASFSQNSRRTASWSGSFSDSFSPPNRGEVKPLGEVLGIHPELFMENDNTSSRMRGGSFGDDLHEVEL